MRTSPADFVLAGIAALAVALAPLPAAAHGVAAEVDQRAGAVAVRVRSHGDRPLAGARFEVRSPRGEAPFAEGTTDRHGWLAFTPDVAGTWTVRVVDAGGHGKVVDVEVADATVAARSAAPPAGAEAGSPLTIDLAPEGGATAAREAAGTTSGGGGGTGGYALRVVAGVTAIVVVFRLLLAVQRSRRARGG